MTPACSLGHAEGHCASADQPGSLTLRLMGTEKPSTFRDGEASQNSTENGSWELWPSLQETTVKLQAQMGLPCKGVRIGAYVLCGSLGCCLGDPNTPKCVHTCQPSVPSLLKTESQSTIGHAQQYPPA